MESGEDIFEFPGERSKEKAAVDGGGEERGEPAEEFVNGELAIEAIVFHAQMDGGNKDLSDEAKKEFVVQAVVRMDSETMEVKSVFESVERFFDHILVPVNINSFLRVIQRIADKNHPATGGEMFFDDVFADRDGIAIRSGRGFADNEVFLKVLSEFGMMGVQKSFLVEFCNKTEEVVSFLHLFLRIEIDKGVQLVAALPPTAYLMHAADNTVAGENRVRQAVDIFSFTFHLFFGKKDVKGTEIKKWMGRSAWRRRSIFLALKNPLSITIRSSLSGLSAVTSAKVV